MSFLVTLTPLRREANLGVRCKPFATFDLTEAESRRGCGGRQDRQSSIVAKGSVQPIRHGILIVTSNRQS
jgi:hypothetical protein